MIKAAYSISFNVPLKLSLLIICFFLLFENKLCAQPPLFKNFLYINKHSQEAVEQMLEYKIPASVILAQAILESRSGTSELAQKSNNHFGIKCHREWGGDTISKDDDSSNECFRKYGSIKDSYTDHSMFLRSRPRYAHLFELPVTDYESWCYGLKNAGYATSISYAEELIKLIENLQLYELDRPNYITPKPIVQDKEALLRDDIFSAKNFPLIEFVESELLFSDEMDIHVRSLNYFIAHKEQSSKDLAEK